MFIISNIWFLQLQQMQSTTVQERNSFGMHNYGNHKAYLAVFFVVSAVNFLSDRRSFLQLHVFSLEDRCKKKISVKTESTLKQFELASICMCSLAMSVVTSPCPPGAPVVFSRSLSLWSAAPEWLWKAAGAWWLPGPGLWTTSSPSPGAPVFQQQWQTLV